MRKKEKNYEVNIDGIPHLKDMPKDLPDLLCAALLDGILSDKRAKRHVWKIRKSRNRMKL